MIAGRYEPIADRWLEPVIKGEQEWMCKCPFCHGDSSLQFNVDSGLWVCFRCDAKGNSERLVKRLGGTYTNPAVSIEHLRQRIDRMNLERRKGKHHDAPEPYDEHYLRRFDFPDPYWSEDRGFSEEAIAKFQLGYDPISDRHTIPFRNEDGDLLGVIQRLKGSLDPEIPRYVYPKHFDRKNSLFGSWIINAEEIRKCGIVEGSTDVVGLWDSSAPALAQYGSSISRGQVRMLHVLGVRELVLFYDYDEAGRKAERASRERVDGIILRAVQYDTDLYCWHKKLCGCGNHTWKTIFKCKKKVKCKCGRKHEMDPGGLSNEERAEMYENAPLVGSKKWTREN